MVPCARARQTHPLFGSLHWIRGDRSTAGRSKSRSRSSLPKGLSLSISLSLYSTFISDDNAQCRFAFLPIPLSGRAPIVEAEEGSRFPARSVTNNFYAIISSRPGETRQMSPPGGKEGKHREGGSGGPFATAGGFVVEVGNGVGSSSRWQLWFKSVKINEGNVHFSLAQCRADRNCKRTVSES